MLRFKFDALPMKWMPLPCELYKVNFDAAWTKDQEYVGIGVVIQNHIGDFLARMNMVGSRAKSEEVTEFIAARASLTFALDAGFTRIILEGDNLGVINATRSREE